MEERLNELQEAVKAVAYKSGYEIGYLRADVEIRDEKTKIALAGVATLALGGLVYLGIKQHRQNKRIAELEKAAHEAGTEASE